MRISLKGTNIKLLESTREYVDKKIVRMVERFIARDDEPIILDIEVGRTTKHHRTGKIFRAEANLKIGKTMLRAEEAAESLNEAVNLVEEELEREIKKFKERRRALLLKGVRRVSPKARQARKLNEK